MGSRFSSIVVDPSFRPQELPWEATKEWVVVEGLEKASELQWNGRTVEVQPSDRAGHADIIFYGGLVAMQATIPIANLRSVNPIEGCKFCRPGTHQLPREQVREQVSV